MPKAVLVRCTDSQFKEWQRAAEADNRTVTQWVRARAIEAAARELGEKGKG